MRLGVAAATGTRARSRTPTIRRRSTTSRSAGSARYVNSIGSDSTPAGSLSGRWQFDSSYSYFLPQFLGGTHEIKAGGVLHAGRLQQVPGSARRGHRRRRQRLPAVFLERRAVRGAALQLAVRGREHRQLSERLRARQLADRRAPDGQFRPARRALQRVPARAVEAGRTASPPRPTTPKVDLYNWSSWAPRLGLSYPLTSDNRTVVKATYGRFNFALRASDSRTIRNFNKNDYSATRYRWNDLNGNRDLDYPGELGTFVATEGGSSTVFNPDIRQPKVDEATVHVEREISSGFSARVGYVYKRESDLFQLVNTARPYSAYNIPIASVDPGPDGDGAHGRRRPGHHLLRLQRGVRRPRASRASPTSTCPATPTASTTSRSAWTSGCRTAGRCARPTWRRARTCGSPASRRRRTRSSSRRTRRGTRRSASRAAMKRRSGFRRPALFEYQSGTPQARDALFRGLPQLSTVTLRMEPIGAQRLPAVKLLNLRAAKRIRLFTSQAMTLAVRSLQRDERQRRDHAERALGPDLRTHHRDHPAARRAAGSDVLVLVTAGRAGGAGRAGRAAPSPTRSNGRDNGGRYAEVHTRNRDGRRRFHGHDERRQRRAGAAGRHSRPSRSTPTISIRRTSACRCRRANRRTRGSKVRGSSSSSTRSPASRARAVTTARSTGAASPAPSTTT